jgi:hypothetical protein
VTSFHHQPEAQHPKSSAIHKLPADYPIFWQHKADITIALNHARYWGKATLAAAPAPNLVPIPRHPRDWGKFFPID